jgi:hypothetical protein
VKADRGNGVIVIASEPMLGVFETETMTARSRAMRIAGLSASVILAFACVVYLSAQPREQEITVTGKLVRVMAIGAESTGWAIEFEAATDIDGKPLSSIQISYRKTGKLEKLENKRVKASGKLTYRQGVETGQQRVLDISSMKEAKPAS